MTAVASYLPSPTQGVFWLGPVPVRMYALCILSGIGAALWICGRRLEDRGYQREDALTVAWWAVPFGILGGRLYNVITSPQPYFGHHGNAWDAFAIWHGGLGIWGAVALGALGAYIGCRRTGITFLDFADSAAPGVILAQAMGRWGNYFNNELHGRATDLPWRLKIYEWDETRGHAVHDALGHPIVLGYYQPTFLYEAIFCLVIALFIVWLDRRRILGRGQSLFLYIMLYPIGRIFMEWMRDDPANRILGQRVNVWVCVLVFLGGLAGYLWARKHHPSGVREHIAERSTSPDVGDDADAGAAAGTRAEVAGDSVDGGGDTAQSPSDESTDDAVETPTSN